MKTISASGRPSRADTRRVLLRGCPLSLAAVAVLLLVLAASAFPPVPHHVIYGVVRDQLGDPIVVTNAEVVLETLAGIQIRTTVIPNSEPGVNYRLTVPMDAGLTADAYQPTALRPTVPFRLKVKIGQAVYLPIEMSGSYANLGKPAQTTLLDLTLGEDSDGDGLPDAWERALIAMLGGSLTLLDVRPEDDLDGDGLTNLQEYLAGTYAFDPQDGFRLEIVGFSGSKPLLEFLAIRGRSYRLLVSPDLRTWTPVLFRIPAEGANAADLDAYPAKDVRLLRIEAQTSVNPSSTRLFFKAQVQ